MRRGHLRLVESPGSDGLPPVDRPIRVLLVDGHLRVRQNLAAVLVGAGGIEVAEEALDEPLILERIMRWHPDVISLAVQIDDGAALELVERLYREAHQIPIVVLTMQRSSVLAMRAVSHGATGVVMKDHADAELVPAVRAAAVGATYISPIITPA